MFNEIQIPWMCNGVNAEIPVSVITMEALISTQI